MIGADASTASSRGSTRSRRIAWALLTALATLTLASCATREQRPTSIEAAARLAYLDLRESLDVDMSPLAGRVIVLDPGHGGGYRGAIGPRGLAESDVNLAVSLFLWGLLREAGGVVTLTRSADLDFVDGRLVAPRRVPLGGEPPPVVTDTGARPESLATDLRARVTSANRVTPDLFLSIHHNAAATGDTTRNLTQTFYRLGDDGPSLDAAQAIHRHLMLNLGTAAGQVLPGNYLVLRESVAAAAVLGEASYLTNPIFEGKLARIDRVELEATAYFLGILEYFGDGVARVTRISPADTTLATAGVTVRASFEGDVIDPATVELRLDGRPLAVAPGRAGGASARVSGPLRPGTHTIEVRARCLAGNAVPAGVATFVIRRPPATLELTPHPPWDGETRPGPLALEVTVTDPHGLPIADSTAVHLRAPVVAGAVAVDGSAWFYVEMDTPAGGSWEVETGALRATLPVVTEGAPAAWSGWVRDPAGKGIAGAYVRSDQDRFVTANRDGFFWIEADSSGADPNVETALEFGAPGYLAARWFTRRDPDTRRWAAVGQHDRVDTWGPHPFLHPRFGGTLHGSRIAVDPAGGGDEPLALGRSGLRGASLTLDTAQLLARYLEDAGARVLLLRDTDRSLPDLARVETAERFGAEIYLRVGMATTSPRARHYPGSVRGEPLAHALARAVSDSFAVRAEVTPVLLQTSCPAVELLLPAPALASVTRGIATRAERARIARSLLLALARHAGYEERTATLGWYRPYPVLVDGVWAIEPRTAIELEPAPAVHTFRPRGSGDGFRIMLDPGDQLDLSQTD